MLRDLTKQDWLNLLNIPEEKIPLAVLLRGTRNLKGNCAKHRALLDDVLEIGSPNGIFEDLLLGSYEGIPLGYASVYGDAMASEITHLFGILGTPLVIQTGCCGALKPDIQAGDIVCATEAYCGDGASRYYLPGQTVVEASAGMVSLATEGWAAPVALHSGRVVTTCALLAEGREEIESWRRQGHIAVDMETASTYAVASHFGMERLSLLFVFDNPGDGDHILLSDGEKRERRALGERVMLDRVLTIIRRYQELYRCRPNEPDRS